MKKIEAIVKKSKPYINAIICWDPSIIRMCNKHQVPIHLGLVRVNDGYEIDIYDCSDNRVCKIIREDGVHLDDLSTLFRNLQEESGILIDIVS